MARKRKPLFRCGRCKKGFSNPLGHTCTVRTDFKRRTAQAKKDAAAAKRPAGQHDYRYCPDKEECRRIACVAWREGVEEAYAEGYGNGFEDGQYACPREHA
jgi:hypothetical protein